MRRKTLWLAAGAAALLGMTGCSTMYGNNYSSYYANNTPATTAAAEEQHSFATADFRSKDGVYQFGEINWGDDQETVESKLGFSLGDLTEFSNGGGYADVNVSYQLEGFVSTGMMPTFDEDGGVDCVTLTFEDVYTAEELDACYQAVVDAATELFGPADHEEESDQNAGTSSSYHCTVSYWYYVVSETQTTSLQVGKLAQTNGTTAVVIGVNSYDPAEATSEEETGEETAEDAQQTSSEAGAETESKEQAE